MVINFGIYLYLGFYNLYIYKLYTLYINTCISIDIINDIMVSITDIV